MKLFRRQARSLKSIDIIWISVEPPDIVECRFSHKFCRETSRELCKTELNLISWIDIEQKEEPAWDEKKASAGLSGGISDSSYSSGFTGLTDALGSVTADYCMVVANPELVISPSAVKHMVNTLEKGYSLCFPVYNETNTPCQTAQLPAVYMNLSTYLEVSEIMAGKNGGECELVSHPDPSCVLFTKKFLKSIDICSLSEQQDQFQEAVDLIYSVCEKGQAVVDRGALIHFFGNYYSGKREDLVKFVPGSAKFILDVGCANGGFGELIRHKAPGVHLTGVEMNAVMAKHAASYYDKIFCEKVENVNFDMQFDHINCGDIIEHLYDPWQMLKLFYSLLKKDGTFVTSLPNAGHWTIVRDLANGEFQYLPLGLLCITHIRWFTENSIKKALESAGFVVDMFNREQVPPTPKGRCFIDHMCKSGNGVRESLLTNEFIIRAVKK